jgi:hypothetical protein
MGNSPQHHPLVNLPRDKSINLQILIPKNEWWTVWYYILTGKLIRVNTDIN